MQTNSILRCGEQIVRVLAIEEDRACIIDCTKMTVPTWTSLDSIRDWEMITESELRASIAAAIPNEDMLDTESLRVMNERYTMICGILPAACSFRERNKLLAETSARYGVCRQTVLSYLCRYLAFQTKAALTPKRAAEPGKRGADEANFRWAINRFYYSQDRNSLRTAYTLMLKERYCDSDGVLRDDVPSYGQFRYFYRKHKDMRAFYISRDGIKSYQRDRRPLLGDGVQQFASHVGVGMLDSTVCDIYLINESGNLVGRPILTTCVDAYSGLCCGYSLTWEGGMYSIRQMLLNVLTDKQKWCERHGIAIDKEAWDCDMLPGELVTDMGAEYTSKVFEQISELGVQVTNLPSFRPELKGPVERFFGVVQDLYKPHLKGCGVIEPDFQERGAHDYREDAKLTLDEFERVILRCIVYYNSQRVISGFPLTKDMLEAGVKPYANSIFEFGKRQPGANLLSVDSGDLLLALLPRTKGRFGRKGLQVNRMRYRNDCYDERYLTGDEVVVAYNPDDVSCVWLVENGAYKRFELIESRFRGMAVSEASELMKRGENAVRAVERENLQARVDLADRIQTIARTASGKGGVAVKNVRETRKRERSRTHRDRLTEGGYGRNE